MINEAFKDIYIFLPPMGLINEEVGSYSFSLFFLCKCFFYNALNWFLAIIWLNEGQGFFHEDLV